MNGWNHIPEHINPNIIEIGSFQIRYYSLMYVIAFAITYLLILYRLKNEKYEYSKSTIKSYFLYAILGVLIGGRLGYVLFYDLTYFLEHPLRIVWPFEYSNGFHYVGLFGMSYHGGLVGVILASLLFCYKNEVNFWHFADLLSPAIPLGYTFGRIGNFLNGELYGRVTSVSWAMYFPLDPTGQLRHPSQLYEAFFEGIFLFIILWSVRKKSYLMVFISACILLAMG
jgi:phosphatidylglycerol:prolipoprotein diacylglycerol transferase